MKRVVMLIGLVIGLAAYVNQPDMLPVIGAVSVGCVTVVWVGAP